MFIAGPCKKDGGLRFAVASPLFMEEGTVYQHQDSENSILFLFSFILFLND